MKTPAKPPGAKETAYERPTPKVSRMKPGKVLSPAEKAAFLAARPDLKPRDGQ